MKTDTIKAVIIDYREHDMKEPTHGAREIKNTLANLQAIVGGNIEIPYISRELAEMGIDMIINEEGKLEDLRTTMIIVDQEDESVLDEIKGNIIFTSHDEDGNTTSLSNKQIEYLENNVLNNVGYLMDTNNMDEGVVYILTV